MSSFQLEITRHTKQQERPEKVNILSCNMDPDVGLAERFQEQLL